MTHMKCLLKCPYSKKSVLPQKIAGCALVTFSLTFHTTVWVFVNLPIYRKLIHDTIIHVFWKPRIFCLVLFWMRYKIVCAYKYLHQKLWLVLLWRKYISFLFISISIMIVVCVILKKALIIFIHNYLRCCEIPQGFISNSSNISDYVKIVEIILTQPRFTLNRFPCEEMREWKQRVQKLHRFDVETT